MDFMKVLMRMNFFTVLFFIVVVVKVTCTTDPSSCQRAIKFMLITACGATKRESFHQPKYHVLSKEEVEQRYHEMVMANMIKGVDKNDVEGFDSGTNDVDDDKPNKDFNDKKHYRRNKRKVFDLIMRKDKQYAEPVAHERKGSFHFMSRIPDEDKSPPPGALKAKCCGGPYLCTMDDFKGFCG